MSSAIRRGGVARARPAPTKRKQGSSCVWSFVLGGMLGAFGVGLYWTQNPDALMNAPAVPVPTPPKVERPTPAPPSFEFPNLLRDTEVDIRNPPPPPPSAPRPQPQPAAQQPSPETVAPTTATAPAAAPSPAPTEQVQTSIPTSTDGKGFLVQVGSFKRGADAERLKAELALLGIPSRVQVATIPSGETYHRVRAGPYPDRGAVDQVRGFLKRHGKDSMTVPVP